MLPKVHRSDGGPLRRGGEEMSGNRKKEIIRIKPIQNGTVIDHLNQGTAYKILEVWDLKDYTVPAAMNVESRKMGKKDVIFIEGKELSEREMEKVALIGKGATLNIIKNGENKTKTKLEYPKMVHGTIKCINPKCISNVEKVSGKFDITENPLMAKCVYCETRMNEEDIVSGIK